MGKRKVKTEDLPYQNRSEEKTITWLPIDQLKLLENNPRKITKEQFDKLSKSISQDRDFFESRPCLVNHETCSGEYIVYAGNQKLRAATKMGWKEVPCIISEDLSEELMNERIIKDNKTYGEWDWDLLANNWDIENLLDCGFTDMELGLTLSPAGEDEAEDKKKKDKCCPHCGEKL